MGRHDDLREIRVATRGWLHGHNRRPILASAGYPRRELQESTSHGQWSARWPELSRRVQAPVTNVLRQAGDWSTQTSSRFGSTGAPDAGVLGTRTCRVRAM